MQEPVIPMSFDMSFIVLLAVSTTALHLIKPFEFLLCLVDEDVVTCVSEEYLIDLLAVSVDTKVPDRLDTRVVLLHYALVRHLLFYLVDSLDVGVDNLRDLLAVTIAYSVLPPETVEVQVEIRYHQGMNKVNESKAKVLPVLKVNRKVEVVVHPLKLFVDEAQHIDLT